MDFNRPFTIFNGLKILCPNLACTPVLFRVIDRRKADSVSYILIFDLLHQYWIILHYLFKSTETTREDIDNSDDASQTHDGSDLSETDQELTQIITSDDGNGDERMKKRPRTSAWDKLAEEFDEQTSKWLSAIWSHLFKICLDVLLRWMITEMENWNLNEVRVLFECLRRTERNCLSVWGKLCFTSSSFSSVTTTS